MVLYPDIDHKRNDDANKDLVPVSQLTGFQLCVVSESSSGVNTPSPSGWPKPRLTRPAPALALARQATARCRIFRGLRIGEAAGIGAQLGPFQGGAPTTNALLGVYIGQTLDVVTEALGQHRASKMRVLAVAGAPRDHQLPDVPTLRAQSGAMDGSAWFALNGDTGMRGRVGRRPRTKALRKSGCRAI